MSLAEAAMVTDSTGCAMLRERVDVDFAVPTSAHLVRLGYTVYPMRFGAYRVAYVEMNPEPGMAPSGRGPAKIFRGDSLIHGATVMF